MSLDRIFVCCDDGNVYETDIVEGKDWCVSFEEYGDDILLLPQSIIPHGRKAGSAETLAVAVAFASELGIPFQRLKFFGGREWVKPRRQMLAFVIAWQPGEAFPRSLLPVRVAKKKQHSTGTLCCYTEAHRGK